MGALSKVLAKTFYRAKTRILLAGATTFDPSVQVFGSPRIGCDGVLEIGRGVILIATPAPIELLVAKGGAIVIGDGTMIESGVILRASHRIVIGKNVRIGAGTIMDDEAESPAGIEIGDDVWIEDGVILSSGERIAPGARVRRADASASPFSSSIARAKESGDARTIDLEQTRRVISRVVTHVTNTAENTDIRATPGWDSLAALRVLVLLEKEFDVMLPHDLFATEQSLVSISQLLLRTRNGETR